MREAEGSLRSTSCRGHAEGRCHDSSRKVARVRRNGTQVRRIHAALAGVALGLYNTVTPDRVRGLVGSRA